MSPNTTASAHTPGPWIAHTDQIDDLWVSAEGGAICCINPALNTNDENLANVRLIAASPRLAEALERLIDVFLDGRVDELSEKEAAALHEADAALADANGTSSMSA